jgi:6-pyruvoyltetrahydropterin/6-carboxytetrahydropterin synthase
MFEVSVEHTFAAAHALREYKGKCERLHGHNYKVQVSLEGPRLNSIGLLFDFVDVKRLLREAAERLDHYFLNEVAPFDRVNPSAENIAKYFFEEIDRALGSGPPEAPVRLAWVRVWETETCAATYRP